MALDVDAIIDDLHDYADYESTGSVSRAKSYITAAVRFLSQPSSASDQGSSHTFDTAAIQQQLAHARAYVTANTSTQGPNVRFLGVGSDFRG